MNAHAEKARLRRQLRSARSQLSSPARRQKSQQACAAALPFLKDHPCVGLYSAIRAELDVAPIAIALEAQGVRVAYPRVVGPGALEFVCARSSDLVAGTLGILEPASETPALPLRSISAFLVPGLGFTPQGARLGWGKGHYDQTLAQCPTATCIGICFQEQVVAALPTDATDVPMHAVITDEQCFHVSASRATSREPT